MKRSKVGNVKALGALIVGPPTGGISSRSVIMPLATAVVMFLFFAAPLAAQVSPDAPPEDVLRGTWTMEDAFTLHLTGDVRIESHPPGRFSVELAILPDGEARLGTQEFVWRRDGDTMIWDFGGTFVRVLPRPVSEDFVLLLALDGGTLENGGAISVLRRQRPRF